MSDSDVDDLLSSTGYGTLSLACEGEAYGLPVSFGYDGDQRVYFVLLETNPPHRKVTFAKTTETASLHVADVDGRFEWQSVVVSGPVRRVEEESDEWDRLVETMDDNAWFSSTFSRAEGLDGIQGWALDAEKISGLQKGADPADP